MTTPTAKQVADCKTISDVFRDHAKTFAGLTVEQQEALLADALLFYAGMAPHEVNDLGNRLQRQAWNMERMADEESRI